MTPTVAQTVVVCPPGSNTTFFYVPRPPPHQPKYGPIEYRICGLIAVVGKKTTKKWTTADFNNRNFDNIFDHCGYTKDGAY